MSRLAWTFAAGLVFGVGLAISGMTDPSRVIAFLDVAHWDPTLMFVMGGAIAVHAPCVWLLRRRGRTLVGKLELPPGAVIDARLVGGAAVFGIGWGLSGYCPGPALVSLISGSLGPVVFVAGLMMGSLFASTWDRSKARAEEVTEPTPQLV